MPVPNFNVPNNNFPNMLLSHIELYVQDVVQMTEFYTKRLGFVITDRGDGEQGMIFLSRSPDEHHQIVLNPRPSSTSRQSPVDHISFRVAAIGNLRDIYRLLIADTKLKLQSVSHGSSWSLYFRDPEENRFEIFTDTPWYVNQPCKFAIDLTLSDTQLRRYTEDKIKGLAGFTSVEDWRKAHKSNVAG